MSEAKEAAFRHVQKNFSKDPRDEKEQFYSYNFLKNLSEKDKNDIVK